MRPRKLVLVVDGDADRLGMRRLQLETQAHLRVIPCASAEDAIVLLKGGLRVEVVVAQWSLPGANGNELCAQASEIDPLMNRVLVDDVSHAVPPQCWAHRFFGHKQGVRDLIDCCKLYACRNRGPKKSAAVRSEMARSAAQREGA